MSDLDGARLRATWDEDGPTEPALTEQSAFLAGVYPECILEQRPLFEGGMDRAQRRKPSNPDQREMFE